MSSYLEAIAATGGSSLHPGGFHHTLSTLRYLKISHDDIVIDVGCGTGRTACYIAKAYGAHVFALDNSAEMLAKARDRAQREKADVYFVHGDVLNMPFRDQVADLIMIESVMVFLPALQGIKECFRVLKKRGLLVDTELFAKASLPPNGREQMKAVCGLPGIPTFREWQQMFEATGFKEVAATWRNFPGPLEYLKEVFYGEFNPFLGLGVGIKAHHALALNNYRRIMRRYRRHFGFGTFIYRKS